MSSLGDNLLTRYNLSSLPPKRDYRVRNNQANQSTTLPLTLTLLELQSRFGDNPVNFQVVCSQNGTAVLKGLSQSDSSQTKPEKWCALLLSFSGGIDRGCVSTRRASCSSGVHLEHAEGLPGALRGLVQLERALGQGRVCRREPPE